MIAILYIRNLKLSLLLCIVVIESTNLGSHLTLSINLIILSTSSMLFAHHSYTIPVYPFLSIDYTTLFSLFCHHINIGCLLILGAGTHALIYLVRDYVSSISIRGLLTEVIFHRCILIGYLIYVSIFINLHSFGLYIHNDTIQSLGRLEDLVSSQVIQSYGTSLSSYGRLFLFSHFTWALSLIFLYSGRGYWQELIESVIFSHHKLGIITDIQPRALSISQGRSVGLTHFVLGV